MPSHPTPGCHDPYGTRRAQLVCWAARRPQAQHTGLWPALSSCPGPRPATHTYVQIDMYSQALTCMHLQAHVHIQTHIRAHMCMHTHMQSPSGSRWAWPAGYRMGAPGRLSLSPSGQRWLVGLCASPQPRTPHPALCQAAPAASLGPRQKCRSHPDPLNRGPDAHCSEPLLAARVWASAPGAIRDPRAGPLCAWAPPGRGGLAGRCEVK